MGFISCFIKCIVKLLLYFAIFVTIIILIPNLPPYTKFTTIRLEPTQQRVGSLAPNNLLNNVEKLYEGKLVGPEAFEVYNGELYTSLATGEIVKVNPGGHVTFVTKLGEPCTGLTQEHKCGRPLGFRIAEKTNSLYVADAYYGIWKVDLRTDKKELLVSPRVPIGGRKPKLFNSIALAKDGDFYWTDSSSDFQLKDGAISVLSDPSGRLFHYNAAKNQSKILLDNLWFANGIELSHDNQFLIVAETCKFRLLKYYIDGPKKGNTEVFIAGLPGIPDNIRSLPDKSGVLVGLYTVFDDDHPLITRTMAATPLVRKFLARLQRLIEIPFEYLNSFYPHFVFEEIVYFIGHFRSVSGLVPSLSGILQLDWNGKVVASYFNTDSSVNHISDAIVYNGKLHTGNPHTQNFIGSVPAPPLLLKAFSAKKVEQQIPKVVQKPQQVRAQEVKPQAQEKLKSTEEKLVPKAAAKPVKSDAPPPTLQQVKSATPTKPSIQPTQAKESETGIKKPLPDTVKQESQPTLTKPVKSTTKSEVKVTPKPSSKPEIKPTPKPEIKLAPKPETKPTLNPENKPALKPEVNPTLKPETKQPPKSDTTRTPKPGTEPVSKTETKATPKLEPKPSPNPTIKPTSQHVTEPSLKSETKSTLKTDTKTGVKPETKPTPKPTIRENSQPKIIIQTPKTETKPISPEIPIKEDIPSDTKRNNKETLKVIKKSGPTEIPNPEL